MKIVCELCNSDSALIYPNSHYFLVDKGIARGMICNGCATTAAMREIPAQMIRPIIENTPLDIPRTGAFQPIEVKVDPPSSGAYEYWLGIGHMVLEEMSSWQGKVLKYTLGGTRYKGMWIKPRWQGVRVEGFELAGDTPRLGLALDVYQRSRLSRLGFQETGAKNRIWNIDLAVDEGEIANASAIIIHILRYGYLLDPSDLQTLTATLDFDLHDPEWSHLRV